MLRLASTYLYVKDIDKSIEFYKALLCIEPTFRNQDRWVQFDFRGKCIALMNKQFDDMRFDKDNSIFSDEYVEYFKDMDIKYGNNFVLNFYIDDLESEYKRIKDLGIGEMSPIMSVDFGSPYYFFIVKDADGNALEITLLIFL